MRHTRRRFIAALGGALCAPLTVGLGCSGDAARQTNRRKKARTRTIVHTHHRKPKRAKQLILSPRPASDRVPTLGTRLERSNAQWKAQMTPLQYTVMRERGTEPAWRGEQLYQEGRGTFHCSACNAPLFASADKYNSHTGWPSFHTMAYPRRITQRPDERHRMQRTELFCAHCNGHLGHVFADKRVASGKRYCVNSVALFFRPESGATAHKGDTTPRQNP